MPKEHLSFNASAVVLLRQRLPVNGGPAVSWRVGLRPANQPPVFDAGPTRTGMPSAFPHCPTFGVRCGSATSGKVTTINDALEPTVFRCEERLAEAILYPRGIRKAIGQQRSVRAHETRVIGNSGDEY